MIELTTLAAQTIPVGGAVTFDNVKLRTGCNECYTRQLRTTIGLRNRGVYEVHFNGNITSDPAAAVQLSIALGGQPLVETQMDATPAAANTPVNVSTSTLVENGCCMPGLDRLTVVNTGEAPVIVNANANFYVTRHS